MPNRCRECHQEFEKFSELKGHFSVAHKSTYIKVEQWIDETTSAKLRSYEDLAAQGLLGAKDENTVLAHFRTKNDHSKRRQSTRGESQTP
jgi:hypothetical protein